MRSSPTGLQRRWQAQARKRPGRTPLLTQRSRSRSRGRGRGRGARHGRTAGKKTSRRYTVFTRPQRMANRQVSFHSIACHTGLCRLTDCFLFVAAKWPGVEQWTKRDWQDKVRRIVKTYRKKAAKNEKNGTMLPQETDYRELMYARFVEIYGIDPRDDDDDDDEDDDDDDDDHGYRVGEAVEVYSRSSSKWCSGTVVLRDRGAQGPSGPGTVKVEYTNARNAIMTKVLLADSKDLRKVMKDPKVPAAQAPTPAGAALARGRPAAAPQGGGGGPSAGRGGGMMHPSMMHGGNPYQNPAVSFPPPAPPRTLPLSLKLEWPVQGFQPGNPYAQQMMYAQQQQYAQQMAYNPYMAPQGGVPGYNPAAANFVPQAAQQPQGTPWPKALRLRAPAPRAATHALAPAQPAPRRS
eukprot:COSAG04_NODE_5003_length_1784_cov_1.626706_2_plen_407_part_00